MSIQTANTKNSENSNTTPYEFEIGEKELLSIKYLLLKQSGIKNFSGTYIRTFQIVAKLVDGNAYRLEMLHDLNQIHPNFHVSLLRPFRYL